MLRIDASKLLSLLLSEEKTSEIKVILSENAIFKKIVEENIQAETHLLVQRFEGKNALVDYVEYAATGSLFSAPLKSTVILPEKLTAKQWEQEKIHLQRLPTPVEVSAYFFAPTLFRNVIKETDFKHLGSVYLCYEPNDIELQKCSEVLLRRYSSLSKKSNVEIVQLCCHALESYSGDLVSCDLHFARMERAGLSFAAALAGNPEVNGFHVAEALASGDKHLIELRLAQCESCGEDAASVFMALVYFLKQLTYMYAALEDTRDMRSAFERARIPFPSQARIQKALQVISKPMLVCFFVAAPHIEMQLRTQRNSHKWLAHELVNLLNSENSRY